MNAQGAGGRPVSVSAQKYSTPAPIAVMIGDADSWAVSALASELNRLCPATVVVMVTSKDKVDAVVAGVRAGSRVYLIKPVSPDDLRQTLRVSLEEHVIRVRDGVSTRRAPLS